MMLVMLFVTILMLATCVGGGVLILWGMVFRNFGLKWAWLEVVLLFAFIAAITLSVLVAVASL